MFDWLDAALRDSSQVITASRRLARALQSEYSRSMLAAGAKAWRSPAILSWQDWVAQRVADSSSPADLPLAITTQQSRVLWERCLRREVTDPLLNIGLLARQSRDTWHRLCEWRVQLAELQQAARNRDQRLFARAAANYVSILEQEHWVDEAGLPDLAAAEILAGRSRLAGNLTLAGFDRLTPQQQLLADAVLRSGRAVALAVEDTQLGEVALYRADNQEAELRAAGVWAREQMQREPDARIAIVVTQLEQDAARSLRLLKEGLIPGWQNAGLRANSVINVSYGRKLIEYPAIAAALLALRWLHSDLTTVEVSQLLLTSLLDANACDELTRVELRLRQQPDQSWTPRVLLAAVASRHAFPDGRAALDRIRIIAEQRERLPKRQSPAAWVALFDELLQQLQWPGTAALESNEFQLVNRWRELLNDVARLEFVSATMTAAEALGRITSIASETVYQPESDAAVVQIMGPLEAAGLQFDKLWITGLSDRNWPPPARPLSLVARDLQRAAGMPDATPADTLDYATRVIRRLTASAGQIVVSFPATRDDVQQSASELLHGLAMSALPHTADPGWNAGRHFDTCRLVLEELDSAPAVSATEIIAGGATTIQRQSVDPFAAFATGRLGVRTLWPIAAGLPASIRGSLIHAALHRLYEECPSRNQIRAWTSVEVEDRTERAVQAAFRPHESHADAVLRRLLQLEKARVRKLLAGVIALDSTRENFQIHAVEQKFAVSIAGANLRLRLDRADINDAAEVLIIDYKTGAAKQLLGGDKNPRDLQLVVYAHAMREPVGGIALLNIDSRAIVLDAAGREFTPDLDWDAALLEWKQRVVVAASQLAAGDVRISWQQTVQAARPFALLSRYQELLHAQ